MISFNQKLVSKLAMVLILAEMTTNRNSQDTPDALLLGLSKEKQRRSGQGGVQGHKSRMFSSSYSIIQLLI